MKKEIKSLNGDIKKHKAEYPILEEQNRKLLKDLEVKDLECNEMSYELMKSIKEMES